MQVKIAHLQDCASPLFVHRLVLHLPAAREMDVGLEGPAN